MSDVTQNFKTKMSKYRLLGWYAALFPTGYGGLFKITVGNYRTDKQGAMRVISGYCGKENKDLPIRAGIVHLWFIILHPFDDGNGRIARALTDMILARSDDYKYRFYSMSSQIQKNKKDYYKILERHKKGTMDVANRLVWFLENLSESVKSGDKILLDVIRISEFWQKNSSIIMNERQHNILNRFLNNFEGKLTTTKWAKRALVRKILRQTTL